MSLQNIAPGVTENRYCWRGFSTWMWMSCAVRKLQMKRCPWHLSWKRSGFQWRCVESSWITFSVGSTMKDIRIFTVWTCLNFELVMNPPFQVLVQLSSHLFSPGGLQSPGAAQRWWRNRKTRDFREAKKVSGTANSDKFWIHLVAGPHWWPENPLDEFLVIDEFPSSGPPRSGVFELRLMTRVSERSNIRGGEPLKDSSGGQDGEREREMGQFVPGTQGLMKDIN